MRFQSQPLNETPIEPGQLKVVCDSMLQGLCKQLRMRGVDAVHVENFEPFENCAKIAAREDRAVLTRGRDHFVRLRQLVKKDHCLIILDDKPEDQVNCIATPTLNVFPMFLFMIR